MSYLRNQLRADLQMLDAPRDRRRQPLAQFLNRHSANALLYRPLPVLPLSDIVKPWRQNRPNVGTSVDERQSVKVGRGATSRTRRSPPTVRCLWRLQFGAAAQDRVQSRYAPQAPHGFTLARRAYDCGVVSFVFTAGGAVESAHRPLLPKPFEPRVVSGSSTTGTSSTCSVTFGRTINCATRSPCSTYAVSVPKL